MLVYPFRSIPIFFRSTPYATWLSVVVVHVTCRPITVIPLSLRPFRRLSNGFSRVCVVAIARLIPAVRAAVRPIPRLTTVALASLLIRLCWRGPGRIVGIIRGRDIRRVIWMSHSWTNKATVGHWLSRCTLLPVAYGSVHVEVRPSDVLWQSRTRPGG